MHVGCVLTARHPAIIVTWFCIMASRIYTRKQHGFSRPVKMRFATLHI